MRPHATVSVLLFGMTPLVSHANLSHASPEGLLGLAMVAFLAVIFPPLIAAITARKGRAWRDLVIAGSVWLTFNIVSCSVPTGIAGGMSTLVYLKRFQVLAIVFVASILVVRLWFYLRRRRTARLRIQNKSPGD
ncbi:MAG: hypothetical protein V4739_19180 [Pseudomonadota bacterium]